MRHYAKLSEISTGDMIEIDGGFTCQKAGRYMVHFSKKGPWFMCDDGRHYLDGQADDDGYLIGIWKS
jgi:hypothetical protein